MNRNILMAIFFYTLKLVEDCVFERRLHEWMKPVVCVPVLRVKLVMMVKDHNFVMQLASCGYKSIQHCGKNYANRYPLNYVWQRHLDIFISDLRIYIQRKKKGK